MPATGAARHIPDVRYRPQAGPLPVETFTLAELRRRVRLDRVGTERLRFHLVVVGVAGSGEHEVDFDRVPVAPRDVLHVAPGQVHRWLRPDRYEAQLVLLPDDAALPAAPALGGARRRQLSPAAYRRFAALLPRLAEEVRHEQPPDRRTRALRAWRELIVQRLDLDGADPAGGAGADRGALPPPYLALLAELETRVLPVRPVTQIAAALGYAPRTVTRACRAATGRTAKDLVDERVFLEVRRLLAHTDRTVAAVAAEAGFSDTANFAAFFRRMAGTTPGRWRSAHAAGTAG